MVTPAAEGAEWLGKPHLFESLVVHETSRILGYVQLTLLNVLPELPT